MTTSRRTPLRLLTAGAASVALCIGAIAPAMAHNNGGDTASNVRGLEVDTRGEGTRMSYVANLQYDRSGENQNGSDIEFLTVAGREYALAGTLRGGMQVIDITRPRSPRRVAVYDCAISQGDIQVWRNKGRVLASYTADGTLGEDGAASRCARDLGLGPDDAGTVLVDLTVPAKPRTVSFLPVERGSHNMTIHPSGKFLYNSNADLIDSVRPAVTIFDVRNPAKPTQVREFPIPFVPLSLGSESHDITFNKSGSRAYVAALSQTLILDTTKPRRPRQVTQILDPSINVVHQSDPVTLRQPDGSKRRLLIITDERAGAAASAECPGGGLHVYDVTRERSPEKLGTWYIPVTRVQDGATCTSHVLRIYPRQKMMTVSWYSQGVRVLDISGLARFEGSPVAQAFGSGIGMREVGSYVLADSDSWSFKTNRIARDGSFFGYSNDLVRGFDVFRFKGLEQRTVPRLAPRDLSPGAATTRATDVLASTYPTGSVDPSDRTAIRFGPSQDVSPTRSLAAAPLLGLLPAGALLLLLLRRRRAEG